MVIFSGRIYVHDLSIIGNGQMARTHLVFVHRNLSYIVVHVDLVHLHRYLCDDMVHRFSAYSQMPSAS